MIAGGVKKQQSARLRPASRAHRVLFSKADEKKLLEEVEVIPDSEVVETPVPDYMVPKYLTSVLYQICEAWTWVNGAGAKDAMNAWPMYEMLKPVPGNPQLSMKVRTKLPLSLARITSRTDKHGNPNPNLGRWYFGRPTKDTHVVLRDGKPREFVRFQQWLDDSTYYKSGALERQVPFLASLLCKEWGDNLPLDQKNASWLYYDKAWKQGLFKVYTYCEEDPISISDANLMLLFAHETLPDEKYFEALEAEAQAIRGSVQAQEPETSL